MEVKAQVGRIEAFLSRDRLTSCALGLRYLIPNSVMAAVL